MPNNLSNPLTWTRLYARSLVGSRAHRDDFAAVKTYCMFLGYPRSGHSLVGSLLDAHPEVIIAHELDVLKFVAAGFNRNQIFYLLLENSRRRAEGGREYSGYSYEVAGQWQGRYRKLRVIGDKKGGRSSTRLTKKPELLDRMRTTIGVQSKFIHVIRNPYDCITTMTTRNQRGLSLENRIDNYFSRVATVAATKTRIAPGDILDVRHEALIAEPKKWLTELCRLIEVEPLPDYLEACAKILFKEPQKSRTKLPWSRENIELVAQRMKPYPFLAGYSYDD
jgi:Sulfotransferase family